MDQSDFDPTYQEMSIDSRIIAALERVSQAFRVLLWTESEIYALSPIQIQVMIFLLYHPPSLRKVSYLAAEFGMTKATISNTIKILEQKGLVKRETEAFDGRSSIIHLSPKGRETAMRTAAFSKGLRDPVHNLHPDDKESLLFSLMDIIRHLNEAGVITIQRMCFTCLHYRPGYKGHAHFCGLLNRKIENNELRLDCPEYESYNQ
jgi:DNA-binding MarR family transcriptional regulator